jgi:uncharacterized protein (DUF488 family)
MMEQRHGQCLKGGGPTEDMKMGIVSSSPKQLSFFGEWEIKMKRPERGQDKLVIWNIGYQGRTQQGFLDTLRDAGVTVLVDLREKPFSRIAGFSKNVLRAALEEAGIAYRPMGKTLGGLTCTPVMWAEGCRELAQLAQGEVVAIMCLERDAAQCHRRKLAEILETEHGIASVPL